MKPAMAADADVPTPLWQKIFLRISLFVIISGITALIIFVSLHFLESEPDPPLIYVNPVNDLNINASSFAAGAQCRLTTIVTPLSFDTSVSFAFVKGASWVTYGASAISSTTTFSKKTDLLRLDFAMHGITPDDVDRLAEEEREMGFILFNLNLESVVSWKKHKDWPRGQFHLLYSCPFPLNLGGTGEIDSSNSSRAYVINCLYSYI